MKDLQVVQLVLKVCALAASAVALGYFGKTQMMKQDKASLIKDAKTILVVSAGNNADSWNNKIVKKIVSGEILQVYDHLLLAFITSILTVVFIVICFMLLFTKTKINKNGYFTLKVLMLGLAIASICTASMINYNLDQVTVDSNSLIFDKDDKLMTNREKLKEEAEDIRTGALTVPFIDENGNPQLTTPDANSSQADRLQDMLTMLDVASTTSFVNFGVLFVLLLTKIY